jgi:hypothetical protein
LVNKFILCGHAAPLSPTNQNPVKIMDFQSFAQPCANAPVGGFVVGVFFSGDPQYREANGLAASPVDSHIYSPPPDSPHTLQRTALVNEAYIRLIESPHQCLESLAHFKAVCARIFRRILVDGVWHRYADLPAWQALVSRTPE